MLVAVGALLFSPLAYVGLKLDAARRPSPQQAAHIEKSNCGELREQLLRMQADANSDISSELDLSGRQAEAARLIVGKGKRLGCRPTISSPYG
jgi:hypothetical protein